MSRPRPRHTLTPTPPTPTTPRTRPPRARTPVEVATAAANLALSPGRAPGVPNVSTKELRLTLRAMVDDPIYRRNLFKALRARTCAPAIEQMCWAYAHGRPKETLSVDGSFAIRWLRAEDALEAVVGDVVDVTKDETP